MTGFDEKLRLYTYRISSDYDAVKIDAQILDQTLRIVQQVIDIVDEKGGS